MTDYALPMTHHFNQINVSIQNSRPMQQENSGKLGFKKFTNLYQFLLIPVLKYHYSQTCCELITVTCWADEMIVGHGSTCTDT